MAMKAGVRGIPDSRLMRGGRQLDRVVGAYPKDHFVSRIKKHARSLPTATATPNAQNRRTFGGNENAITPMKEDWLPPGVTPAEQ